MSYATRVRERAIGLALLVGMLLTGACTGGGPHPPTEAPTTRIPSGFVVVPDVVGLSTASAVVAMDDAGLAFEINPVGGSAPLVIREDPEAGTPVPVGSTVALDASCYPAPCPFFFGSEKRIYDQCTCAAR